MPKSSSNKYPLVPSVQFRASRLAPLALMPAVPVQLGGDAGPKLYATIDTGAKISAVAQSALEELERIGIKPVKRSVEATGASTEIVYLSLQLCDPAFAAWIDLGEVPFAILPGTTPSEPTSRIVLGFDSCLAKLRIDIDYPHNVLTIHSRAGVAGKAAKSDQLRYPTGIAEAERLIAMGSYRAAVAIIAAAVEEALLSSPSSQEWPQTGKTRNLLADATHVSWLASEPKSQLQALWKLRNTAVHGPTTTDISKRDAEASLRAAKGIIAAIDRSKSVP